MSSVCFISVKLMIRSRLCSYFVWQVFQKLFSKLQFSSAWLNCRPVDQFWPANNYDDQHDYNRVAMRPKNSGHVQK